MTLFTPFPEPPSNSKQHRRSDRKRFQPIATHGSPYFHPSARGVCRRRFQISSERERRGCPGVFPLELPAGTAFTDLPYRSLREIKPLPPPRAPPTPCFLAFRPTPPLLTPFRVPRPLFRLIFRFRSARRLETRDPSRLPRGFFFALTLFAPRCECFNYSS